MFPYPKKKLLDIFCQNHWKMQKVTLQTFIYLYVPSRVRNRIAIQKEGIKEPWGESFGSPRSGTKGWRAQRAPLGRLEVPAGRGTWQQAPYLDTAKLQNLTGPPFQGGAQGGSTEENMPASSWVADMHEWRLGPTTHLEMLSGKRRMRLSKKGQGWSHWHSPQ